MKILYALLISILLTAVQSLHAQSLLHYWHFNGLPTGNLPGAEADSSVVQPAPFITYPYVGPGEPDAGFLDRVAGSALNARLDEPAGQGLRVRNPSENRELRIPLPTTGFENVVLTYAATRTNNGMLQQAISYTTDGLTFTNAGLIPDTITLSLEPEYTLYTFDFSSVAAANNNPDFAVRIRFVGNNSGTSGNNRIDNVALEGFVLGTGGTQPPAVSEVLVLDSTQVSVRFNKSVTPASAQNVANFTFAPALAIGSAVYDDNTRTTLLTTAAPLSDGINYTLSVVGISDTATPPNIIVDPVATSDLYFNGYEGDALIFTEIMYNPGSGAASNALEFIEVYNRATASVPIGGLRMSHQGVNGQFPELLLAPGAAALLAFDSAAARAFYGDTLTFFLFSGALSNGGATLTLRNSRDLALDSLTYDDASPWPTEPDGNGPSLERVSLDGPSTLPSNWRASTTSTGQSFGGNEVFATPGFFVPQTNGDIAFSAAFQSVSEDTAAVSVSVTLVNPNAQPARVTVLLTDFGTATPGQDFVFGDSLVLTFPANSSEPQTFNIPVLSDTLPESDEYFVLALANPQNANLTAALAFQTVYLRDTDKRAPLPLTDEIGLTLLTSYRNGSANQNSTEIVAHDPGSQRLFIANSVANKVDIVNFSNPADLAPIASIDISAMGSINSIAVRNGLLAAAIENADPQLPGKVVFMNIEGNILAQVDAGAMPDMIAFTPDGTKVVTADEGEPNSAYTLDPEGSVTIVDISGGIANLTQANVRRVTFESLNPLADSLRAAGVRIFGPNASVAQDLEPEYVDFSADSRFAYVALQENNAILIVDLDSARIHTVGGVPQIWSLGYKDHSLPGNELDASDRGGQIHMARWNGLRGMYQPDAIAAYQVGGQTYIVTANEGDARDYNGFSEEASLSEIPLNPTLFPDSTVLRLNENLGRLNISNATGDLDGDGFFDEIHVLGGRSFAIYDSTGQQFYDSGDELERIIKDDPFFGAIFNANQTGQSRKNRSDNKGPEPEGVVLAQLNGQVYAFLGLERIGGVMVYNITDPTAPRFVQYVNNRSIPYNASTDDAGAEGLIFITAQNSPNGDPLLVVANEVSNSLSVFRVDGVTSAAVREVAEAPFYAYPNPAAAGTIYFNRPAQVQLYDVTGREVSRTATPSQSLSTKHLRPGIYVLRTQQGHTQRIVVR